MQFQVNTPQTMGALIAAKESRKASKRKAANATDTEQSTKKQKVLHDSVPLAPTPTLALHPASAHFLPHVTTLSGPTEEAPTITDDSQLPAQTQAHNATDLGHAAAASKKRKSDNCSLDSSQVAQAHHVPDLEPITKKQKLSAANLPSARAQKRPSSEERDRIFARNWRKRLEGWCRLAGYDPQILSRLSDETITDSDFHIHKYVLTLNSSSQSNGHGALELGVHPSDGSSAETLIAEIPKLEVSDVLNQNISHLPHYSPARDTPVEFHSVSFGRSSAGCSSPEEPCLVNEILNEDSSFYNDSAIPLLSSASSSFLNTFCSPSDLNEANDTRNASLDRSASATSVRGTAATDTDQIAPSSPTSTLRGSPTNSSSSRTSSIAPPRNRGGRPKGRNPQAAKISKILKGPMRFQKNHPVKAAVNVDIWENILSFCPPDFLLKARMVSSTFRSVLKDDSPIWKISRVRHFGSDMPNPPSNLSEPQYADLLTGTGCQTRGCNSKKARKTYWAFQKRLCMDCFNQAWVPPRALARMYKELQGSESPQYRSISGYYRNMEEFLPGLKFDRWDNYQWLGNYDPTPSWGEIYRSGQYVAFPASVYANFSSELANLMGTEYDVEHRQFSSNKPLDGKTCPPQDVIDEWFDTKRAINDALVLDLQAVENWFEIYKRNNQKVCKDLRKSREIFYEQQAELAGLDKSAIKHYESYQAAIAISKPATMQSWKILLPKLKVECEVAKLKEMEEFERAVDEEMNYQWTVEEWESYNRSVL